MFRYSTCVECGAV